MNRTDAIRKIRACLDRAKATAFPAEAARAMAQAKALMQRFGIEQPELLAAGVREEWAKGRAAKAPPTYEVMLANVVADQFECNLIFSSRWDGIKRVGGYTFVGNGATAEIAAYTFAVLSNQLRKARESYTCTHLQRYRKNKVAAADEFCRGWVYAVREGNTVTPASEERTAAIAAYIECHYPTLDQLATRKRELAHQGRADQHGHNGYIEGGKAKVNVGIEGGESHLQLEHA